MSALREYARAHGPLPEGHVRVVVIEADASVRVRDFASRAEGEQYLADVRWEADGAIAELFDAL